MQIPNIKTNNKYTDYFVFVVSMFQLISPGESQLGEDLVRGECLLGSHANTGTRTQSSHDLLPKADLGLLYSAHHQALAKIGEHLCLFFLAIFSITAVVKEENLLKL